MRKVLNTLIGIVAAVGLIFIAAPAQAEAAPKPAVNLYYNINTDASGSQASYTVSNNSATSVDVEVVYTSENGFTNQTGVITLAPGEFLFVASTPIVTGNGIVLTAELKLYDPAGSRTIDRVRVGESR